MRPSPEALALGLVLADPDRAGAALARDRADHLDQMLDLGGRPVELADQERLDVERVAGVAEILGGVDRRPVHHLEPARNDAVGDDRGDAVAALLGGWKADQQRLRGLGLLQDPHRDLGDHPQQPLRAGHQAQEIVALGIEMLAAQAHDVAVRQHHLEAQQVVGGEAVLQAVHAARVLGDVAADRAGDLAGGIGRIVEARVLHRVGDAEVGHAGLGDDAAVLEVDLEDPVEFAQPQHDAVGERQGAARERGAGAARHDLDALLVAQGQDRRDLLRGARQHDRHRQRAIGGQAVALVGAQLVLRRDHALARHDLAQLCDDRIALGERGLIRLRHAHAHPPPPRRSRRGPRQDRVRPPAASNAAQQPISAQTSAGRLSPGGP